MEIKKISAVPNVFTDISTKQAQYKPLSKQEGDIAEFSAEEKTKPSTGKKIKAGLTGLLFPGAGYIASGRKKKGAAIMATAIAVDAIGAFSSGVLKAVGEQYKPVMKYQPYIIPAVLLFHFSLEILAAINAARTAK